MPSRSPTLRGSTTTSPKTRSKGSPSGIKVKQIEPLKKEIIKAIVTKLGNESLRFVNEKINSLDISSGIQANSINFKIREMIKNMNEGAYKTALKEMVQKGELRVQANYTLTPSQPSSTLSQASPDAGSTPEASQAVSAPASEAQEDFSTPTGGEAQSVTPGSTTARSLTSQMDVAASEPAASAPSGYVSPQTSGEEGAPVMQGAVEHSAAPDSNDNLNASNLATMVLQSPGQQVQQTVTTPTQVADEEDELGQFLTNFMQQSPPSTPTGNVPIGGLLTPILVGGGGVTNPPAGGGGQTLPPTPTTGGSGGTGTGWGAAASQMMQGAYPQRQSELPENEVAALSHHPDYKHYLDPTHIRLLKEKERGNVGAGTLADGPIADLWGLRPTVARPDLKVHFNDRVLDVSTSGGVVSSETEPEPQDQYTFLPFAKLGGNLVWIPRHVQTARFFFTAEDYSQLVENIVEAETLKLKDEETVDIVSMWMVIRKIYKQLQLFCGLSPPLPPTASLQQVYAEWLELRQITRAVALYEQNTGGMYENSALSMRGGIRAAVSKALESISKQLGFELPPPPNAGEMTDETQRKRGRAPEEKLSMEEFNPQFSFEPISLKRTKFSIPTI